MKKTILLSLSLAASLMTAKAQSRVQVIHNSADLIADSVDVYLDNTLLLDNFAFRTATPFIDAPSGTPITLGIAPKGSTSVADTIYSLTTTLTAGEKYIIVANGLVSSTGYSPAASAVPFRLSVFNPAREEGSTAGNTDILVVHGSTDAPIVDVKTGTTTLVDNIAFGSFASGGYLSVPVADYTLDVTNSAGTTIVKRYSAPLATLGLSDSAITVVASGFLDSTVNSNGAGFGLWVALPEGGNLIPLPSLSVPARVQVIHNSADLIADSVDVYLDNTLLLDNFTFRTATPFIDAPSSTPITLGVAPKGSTSVADTIYSLTTTLSGGDKYIIVANGLVSSTGYSPAASTVPFRLSVFSTAREEASTAGNTDILVVHGSTDAPVVDVKTGTTTLVDDIAFGAFASGGYLSVPEADYTLDITESTGTTIVKRYSAPLAALNLGDSAITVVASGFLDSTVNSNGAGFGLWVALPEGGNLIPLPLLTVPSSVQSSFTQSNVTLYPNPVQEKLTIKTNQNISKYQLSDVLGRTMLSVDVNTANLSIDMIQFANGIYLLNLIDNTGNKATFRVVKE